MSYKTMQNTQMDNQDNESRVKDTSISKKVGVLYEVLIELHKRTERLVAALFLLTDLMSDNNPIRQRVRALGIESLSLMLSSDESFLSDGVIFSKKYSHLLVEISSLLEVAYLSEQISEMNFRIISGEIESMIVFTERLKKTGQQSFESKSATMFNGDLSDTNSSSNLQLRSILKRSKGHKGQSVKSVSVRTRTIGQNTHNSETSAISIHSRKDLIMGVLKDGRHLTVKDFLSVISGVSEKTVQRELVSLVSEGVLKREGERRWSRYFITPQT